MSLTLKQNPNTSSGYPHGIKYPNWIIVKSNQVSNHFDFKYKFTINSPDIESKVIMVSPDENGLGLINLSNYVSNFTAKKTNYDIENVADLFITQKNYYRNYNLKVEEYYNGAGHNPLMTDNYLGANLKPNTYNNVHKEFFNHTTDLEFFTNRGRNVVYSAQYKGQGFITFLNGDTTSYSTDIDGFQFRLHYNDGSYLSYNGNFGVSPVTFSHTGSLQDLSNMAFSVKTNLESIKDVDMWSNEHGAFEKIYKPEDIVRYEIQPFNLTGLTGPTYKFKVECTKPGAVNIHWINSYGALEYFPFSLYFDKTVQSEKELYNHNSIVNGTNNYHESHQHDISIFKSNNIQSYKFRTNWLSKDEASLLRDLAISKEYYFSNDDSTNLKPIVLKSVSLDDKTKPGLVQYTIEFMYGKEILS